jgi:hypothetical protein
MRTDEIRECMTRVPLKKEARAIPAYKPDNEKVFHTVKLASAARGLDLLSGNLRLVIAHANGYVRLYRMTAQSPAEKTATPLPG